MSKRLEEYLEEVSRPVPAADRKEWREESAQHMAALIAAYEELGHSQDEATELAITKFGDAKQLGQRMRFVATRPPASLLGAAALFLFQGCMCWYLTIPRFLASGEINQALLVWGAPALLIGVGLLRRRSFWRSAALVSVWTTLAVAVPFSLGVTNWVRDVPAGLAAFRVMLYCVIPLWQYWVLTRADVRAMFEDAPIRPARSPG